MKLSHLVSQCLAASPDVSRAAYEQIHELLSRFLGLRKGDRIEVRKSTHPLHDRKRLVVCRGEEEIYSIDLAA